MVPRTGLEPVRPEGHKILSLACLPIPPPRLLGVITLTILYNRCKWESSMQPNSSPSDIPDPRSKVTPPARDHSNHYKAVAQMTREQIDQIYAKQLEEDQSREQNDNPYQKTHTPAHTIDQPDWKQYHSAWQNYYQEYYGRHYATAYQNATKYLSSARPSESLSNPTTDNATVLDRKQAVEELRGQLLEKVHSSAKKVRKSRHFVPIIAGVLVLGIFSFLQYNSTIIAYAVNYISPGNIDPQNIIADPNLSTSVDQAPRLVIPKINVDISVDYNATPEYNSQMAAMKDNVAYFGIPGANSRPGQLGNVPLSGHSSNDFTDSGNAKFIFARLEQLSKGDIFYLNYEGTRYTYTITRTTVVKPSEVAVLQVGTDKPYATLITCTPLGTAEKRLIVFAEQISPSPSEAKPAPSTSDVSNTSTQMAGKSPTVLERAFGAR